MGGFMSPFAAKVTCIVREHRWQQVVGRALHGPFRAVRLMDDTPIVFHVLDAPILSFFQLGCYRKESTLEQDVAPAKKIDSLGTTIQIHPDNSITVVSKNKNEESILSSGTMKYLRYPAYDADVPKSLKYGMIKGQICRMVRDTSFNAYHLLKKPIWIFIFELVCRHYPWEAIHRMFRQIHTRSLPVKPEGMHTFTKMWGQVMTDLHKVVHAPHQRHVVDLDVR